MNSRSSSFLYGKRLIIVIAFFAVASGVAIAHSQWKYFVIFFIPIMLYLCIEKPFIFPFGAFVFLLPFDAIFVTNIGGALTKYLAFLSVTVFLIKGMIEKKLNKPDPVVIWWVIFVFFALLSVIWAVNPELTISRMRNAVGFLLLYLVMASYKSERKEYELLKQLIFIGGLIAAIFLIVTYKSQLSNLGSSDRISLSYSSKHVGLNSQGFNLLIPMSICISLLLTQKRRFVKMLFLFMIFLFALAIIITGSRGSFFAAVAMVLVYLLYLPNVKRKLALGFTMLIAALIISPFIPDFFLDRMSDSVDSRASGRGDIWIVGLISLQKYWFYGAGLDNFPMAYNDFIKYAPDTLKSGRASHNIFIGMLVELGIIGFTLLIIGMIKHYRSIGKRDTGFTMNQIMLKAAFWGILVAGLSMDSLWDKGTWLIWIMILMSNGFQNDNSSVQL